MVSRKRKIENLWYPQKYMDKERDAHSPAVPQNSALLEKVYKILNKQIFIHR